MGILDLFGLGNKTNDIKEFVEKGAVIIDVRTPGEYVSGHIKGSKNIPLDTISSKINEIKKLNKPVIACCRSGMRSGQATSILKQHGIECINGGGWDSLQAKL
ncbi:rhodanese-like domain-containing protein [Flavobacterium luminosum]|uniref:Rhodanese-like domain-containing protein n=1 Tax=Flavobacterium luminosum TaxID=2949086 RepID=A0ABT0TK99_9FLAO|nr:rhodanese-like domain-containing protein [Flavobacterium sp. HXWNR70]MCL9807924.1 rhodanese-like domain-containing protein [Flavobacterium sp. HXWNR70]